MRGKVCLVLLFVVLAVGVPMADGTASDRWDAPFDSTDAPSPGGGTPLSFADVLGLVARHNPTLQSLVFRERASRAGLTQASLWPNPELEAELEEFSWEAPGVSESEMLLLLSQELELFGQRGARKQVAQSAIDATELATRVAAFDLYVDAKERFYRLAHAQKLLALAETSVTLANDIVDNINFRIGKGAALQSEFLLARLEQQRSELVMEQARQDVLGARALLVSLWEQPADDTPVTVSAKEEPEFARLVERLADVHNPIDSTRGVMQLRTESARVQAEQSLATVQARPSITVSGGIKRAQAAKANSFVLGVGLPLPIFHRNQGERQGLAAQQRSLDFEMARARQESGAAIASGTITLRQLIQRHHTLDSALLPTAADAYETLQSAYEAGRVPYTQLLEAERSLNELRFEHADLLLDIHRQIIALERVTGITLRVDEEL